MNDPQAIYYGWILGTQESGGGGGEGDHRRLYPLS